MLNKLLDVFDPSGLSWLGRIAGFVATFAVMSAALLGVADLFV
jgi:hypothetical protein